MNPYEVMGLIACCVSLFAGVVTFLIVQGVSWPVALLLIYFAAVGCMLGMQRRARESGRSGELRRRHRERSAHGASSIDAFHSSSVGFPKSSGL